jgi:hypothetical protein
MTSWNIEDQGLVSTVPPVLSTYYHAKYHRSIIDADHADHPFCGLNLKV